METVGPSQLPAVQRPSPLPPPRLLAISLSRFSYGCRFPPGLINSCIYRNCYPHFKLEKTETQGRAGICPRLLTACHWQNPKPRFPPPGAPGLHHNHPPVALCAAIQGGLFFSLLLIFGCVCVSFRSFGSLTFYSKKIRTCSWLNLEWFKVHSLH